MAKKVSYDPNRKFSSGGNQPAAPTGGKKNGSVVASDNLNNAGNQPVNPATQAQATNQQSVDDQDWRTRLWQSIQNGANYAIDQSNKAYTQAMGASDRQATSRGMGRSSYNIATQANMGVEQANAANKIVNDAIADYQNRVTQQENEEWQRNFQQQQFNENQRQFNANLGENQRQFNENMGFNREQLGENQRQFNENMGLQRDQLGENQRQFNASLGENQRQFDANLGENQRQFNANLGENQRQFNENMGYQRERASVADQQWRDQFNENQRQFNANLGENQRQFNENMGFQREQFNYGKSQAENSGGGYGGNGGNTTNTPRPTTNPSPTSNDPFGLGNQSNQQTDPRDLVRNLPSVTPRATQSPRMTALQNEANSLANKGNNNKKQTVRYEGGQQTPINPNIGRKSR